MLKCTRDAHFVLMPFFYVNSVIQKTYNGLYSPEECTASQFYSGLQCDPSEPSKPYFCLTGYSTNWDENDWTLRLFNAITEWTKHTANYTANLGPAFSSFLRILHLPNSIHTKVFLTQGACDAVFETVTVVHRELTLLENSHQRAPLKGAMVSTDPPEKLGEIIASTYCLLVAKVINAISNPYSANTIESRGIIIDKLTGVAECTLSIPTLENGVAVKPKVVVDTYFNGLLLPEILCAHMSKYLDDLHYNFV